MNRDYYYITNNVELTTSDNVTQVFYNTPRDNDKYDALFNILENEKIGQTISKQY